MDQILKAVVNLEDPSDTFISSSVMINILQEIHDIYFAHLYDANIKAALLRDLIFEILNPLCLKNN